MWGSLKQRTKPLLQNLSIRIKKSSTKRAEAWQRYPLDRRLSSSVPDMLNVETTTEEEETEYSRSKALSTFFPSDFSPTERFLQNSSNASLTTKEWHWSQQQTVSALDAGVSKRDQLVVCGPGAEARRKSSEDLFELLQRSSFSSDHSEETSEVMCKDAEPSL